MKDVGDEVTMSSLSCWFELMRFQILSEQMALFFLILANTLKTITISVPPLTLSPYF